MARPSRSHQLLLPRPQQLHEQLRPLERLLHHLLLRPLLQRHLLQRQRRPKTDGLAGVHGAGEKCFHFVHLQIQNIPVFSCSASCGACGVRARRRDCYGPPCPGALESVELCNFNLCPTNIFQSRAGCSKDLRVPCFPNSDSLCTK